VSLCGVLLCLFRLRDSALLIAAGVIGVEGVGVDRGTVDRLSTIKLVLLLRNAVSVSSILG
jgi:hypothetical protein